MAKQNGWRWCKKCQGLFFAENPDKGTCPAGGQHDDSASGLYAMLMGDGIPGAQDGWRWCRKCQGFFFAENPDKGACPTGGQHDDSASGHYVLQYGEDVPGTQPGWHWCHKCQGLFFGRNPDTGACPAGGQHDTSQGGFYGVPWQPALFYTFRMDQFQITDTRAFHNDTDYVVITLKVGDESLMLTKSIGDVNNGYHDVGLEFPLMRIDDPKTPITLNFAIMNSGNNGNDVTKQLQSSLDQLIKDFVTAAGGEPVHENLDGLATDLLLGVFDISFKLLFQSCDGTVAADSFAVPRSVYDQGIPQNGRILTHTKAYPGTNPGGPPCGVSHYKVTHTLIRTEEGDGSQPAPNKAFILLSRSSGLVLDVPDGSNVPGTPIQQSPDNGGQNQGWRFIPVDQGFFQIQSLTSGLILDVEHSSGDDHAAIIQWPDNGGHNQHWAFVPVAPSDIDFPFPVGNLTTFFKIRSRLSGKVLDIPGRSAEPQVHLQQYTDQGGNNQLWQLIAVSDV